MPSFHLHLDVVLVLGGVWLLYIDAERRHRTRSPGDDPDWRRRRRFFTLGMLTLFVGASYPIHDLAERYLYSMHMVQHLLFTLVAAPMLVVGVPAWMWRSLFRARWVERVWRFVTRPLVAILLYNGVLLFTHWPAVVEASVRSEPLHFSLHLLLVVSAFVMWWPVLSPLPEMPPLSAPMQMLYLFLQSIAPTIPASFLTFGHTPLYPVYATFPRIWGISVLDDQLIAGLVMKLAGTAILWGFIAAIFFRWHEQESKEGFDPVRLTAVERDVRAGLGKP
jgi:putative membrane protein